MFLAGHEIHSLKLKHGFSTTLHFNTHIQGTDIKRIPNTLLAVPDGTSGPSTPRKTPISKSTPETPRPRHPVEIPVGHISTFDIPFYFISVPQLSR